MMYRCAPTTSGSRKILKKRGKSLRVDIHCHYLNTEAAAAVARHNPAQFDLLARFSNQLTREVNAKQIQERAAKLTSIGQRLKDMDRMGIDVQAVSPAPHQTYYWCEPGEGAELARTVNERIAGIVAQWPERFVGLGSVSAAGRRPRDGGAGIRREEARPSRRQDQSERRSIGA